MTPLIKKDALYIVDGVRTPISSPFKSLKKVSAVKMGGAVLKALIKRNNSAAARIDEVIMGNAIGAGNGQNVARQAALKAGIRMTVPAYTQNAVCGSGLRSVISAAQVIKSGDAEIILAGGTESATRAPYLIRREDVGSPREINIVDSLFNDGLYCWYSGKSMGELIEQLAIKHRISRQEQDQYALESHRKACAAQTELVFQDEITPVASTKVKIVHKDDRPRQNVTLSSFGILPPAFRKRGTVTAGNTAAACDGASGLMIASGWSVQKYKLKPLARIIGYASIAIDPVLSFESTMSGIRAGLKAAGIAIKDVDLFEIGEAFAAQIIMTQRVLRIPEHKINIYGGDIAFGHPLGSAGSRLLVTLCHALKHTNQRIGLACIAYGGGGAMAVVVERHEG